ncbi:MAG: hypothetical protein M3Z03_15905, partial [Actinomycetota bacterium]|nr:hypothetical protein [Actinomycetota bacterium]
MSDDLLIPMLERWAASGAMWLTGRADGPPLGPPARLVPALDALGPRLVRAVSAAGGDAGAVASLDPLGLLGERAAEA